MICTEGIFYRWKESQKSVHVVLHMDKIKKLMEVELPINEVKFHQHNTLLGEAYCVTRLIGQKIRVWHSPNGLMYEVDIFDPGQIFPSAGCKWHTLWEINPQRAELVKFGSISPKTKNKLFLEKKEEVFGLIKKECPYYSDENLEARCLSSRRRNEETEMLRWALKHGSDTLKNLITELSLVGPGLFSDLALQIRYVKPGEVSPGGRVDFSDESHMNLVDSIMRTIERTFWPPLRDDA